MNQNVLHNDVPYPGRLRMHRDLPVSPLPENAFLDTEPSRGKKTNQGKAISDAEGLFKRRMEEARSDEERARPKEDLKVEMGEVLQSRGMQYPTTARATA